MNRNSQLNQRKNNHIQKSGEIQNIADSLQIHIFSKDKSTPILESLQQQLKNKLYLYQYHEQFNQLKQLILGSKRKTLVLICTDNDQQLNEDNLPSSYNANLADQRVKLYTFCANKSNNHDIPNLTNTKQVIQSITAFKDTNKNPIKIKLAGVHSIRVSKDKKIDTSRSIKKVSTESTYQKVFYFKSHYNQYGINGDSTYQHLAQSLEGEANFQPFKSTRQLEKKDPPKGKKKYLVLTSISDDSIKIMSELKKAKLRYFDYLLLGYLQPSEYFLDDNVILASDNPLKHIVFLLQNGFQSYNLRSIADNFSKKYGDMGLRQQDRYNLNDNPSPYQGELPKAQIEAISNLGSLQSARVDQKIHQDDHGEKRKIRKIKSPSKARIIQTESNSDVSNMKIIVPKHNDEAIIENDDFRTNKQGEKFFKKQSTQQNQSKNEEKTIFFNSRNTTETKKTNYQSDPQIQYDFITPQIENQFSIKKASGIQQKYRKNPSVIIQEMSDQYRGSNKESIMNLEPQKQKTQINQISQNPHIQYQPQEENTMKKIVNKGITYANQPETYYINSKTMEYIKTNPSMPETVSNRNITTQRNRGNTAQSSIGTNALLNRDFTVQSYKDSYIPYSPSSRVISGAPITVTSAASNASNNTINGGITYGKPYNGILYQSPSKVIRKEEITAPEQVVGYESKQKQQNRMTFGSNNSNDNKTLNYSISNSNSSFNNYNYPYAQANSSSYYNVQSLNYHTLNSQPYTSKIHIATGKTQQVVTPIQKQTPIEGVKSYNSNHVSPLRAQEKNTKQITTSTLFNSQDYEQIERDGRIVYRKKIPIDARQYTPMNYVSPKVEQEDNSPAVRRYQVSPIRREQNIYQHLYEQKRKQPQVYSNNQYQYHTSPKSNYEVITIPYKTEDHNLGQMIESSHKKKAIEESSNTRLTDNKNFVSVSYKNQENNGNANINNYKQYSGVRVYGVNHPRVEVQRFEKTEPKVEAGSPKVDTISPSHKVNALNQSNWFSRMSQLHSDGSILRRNNVRFGIKLQKKEEKPQNNSVLQNKMVSGIYKINDLNKKMALNRIIRGEDYIDEEKGKYIHINSKINRFHFIIQSDMDYLVETIKNHLSNSQDKIEQFTGVSSLFTCLKAQSDEEAFDIGFIFAKAEELSHINTQLIPEHYFTVSIVKEQQGLLQINQAQKNVKIDQLRHFSLVQKIILDSKLYQYVAYRNNQQEIELLADKFMNSEFILEKIETEFTTEILDCYYYQLPRLTRLYLLCDEQQLPKMLGFIKSYNEVNPSFNKQTCKLVCVLSNILGNDDLIMSHPFVTFISNPEQIKQYKDILKYAHHSENPFQSLLPIDNIFYYCKHKNIEEDIASQYPGRFSIFPFSKISEIYPKIDRMDKITARYGYKPKNYLVLHQNVNAEKIRIEYFAKIFMLGKAKVIQNKVVRVMNIEQLLELLK